MLQRAGYQAAVWRRALVNTIDSPSADGHGWCLSNGGLKIKWMTQDPAPADVLQDIYCRCEKDCSSQRCSCKKAKLKCTDVCQCNRKVEKCSNRDQPSAAGSDDEAFSDDSDSEGKKMQIEKFI